jgi:hypothetical protein
MDELSDAGRHARKLAVDPTTVTKYILKPSLEGGGHNVYGDAIPGFLAQLPNELWPNYVLMERIQAPHAVQRVDLAAMDVRRSRDLRAGRFWHLSEEKISEKSDAGAGIEQLQHAPRLQEASWSFKTKAADMDETSVVKGFGVFDSPALVNGGTFASCCQPEEEERSVL